MKVEKMGEKQKRRVRQTGPGRLDSQTAYNTFKRSAG
jgi:hypothetical protein